MRALAPLHLLQQLPDGEAVVLYQNLPPARVRLRRWFADKDLRRLASAEVGLVTTEIVDPRTGELIDTDCIPGLATVVALHEEQLSRLAMDVEHCTSRRRRRLRGCGGTSPAMRPSGSGWSWRTSSSEQIRAGLAQVLVQELGRVDNWNQRSSPWPFFEWV